MSAADSYTAIVSALRTMRTQHLEENVLTLAELEWLDQAATALEQCAGPEVPEGMMLVSKESVALAWSIAKERRDFFWGIALRDADMSEKELELLSAAGFDKHLPTIMELRGLLKDESGATNGESSNG